MFVRRRLGYRRLLSGTTLGFVVMLGLLGLATGLIFLLRGDLDLAREEETAAKGRIAQEVMAREEAEARAAGLESERATMRRQIDDARVAKGIADEALAREISTRIATEEQSIAFELAKIGAERDAQQAAERQAAAEQALDDQTADLEAAQSAAETAAMAQAAAERTARESAARARALHEPLLRGIVDGELAIGVPALPAYAAEGVEEAVAEAMERVTAWDGQGFTVREAADDEEPGLSVVWVRELDEEFAEGAVGTRVQAPLGARDCNGAWRPYDGETVKRLLVRQVGFALGYGPSEDEASVMHRTPETRFAAAHEVDAVLSPNHWEVVRLCGEGDFSYAFTPDAATGSFEIAVVRPGVGQDDYFDPSNHYAECDGGLDNEYSNQCAVEEGAVMLVFTRSAVLRVAGSVQRVDELSDVDLAWDDALLSYSDAELAAWRELFG